MSYAMMTTYIFGALLAAATPIPVHVENWPGPDAVGLDTLKYARWAFWATIFIGIPALGFAFIDYLLNLQQFRRPKLVVSVEPSRKRYTANQDILGLNCGFIVNLYLANHGTRAAKGCYVAIWLPTTIRLIKPNGWVRGGDFPEPTMGVEHERYELFVEEPVFLEHPLTLPPIGFDSVVGPQDFHIRWQVYDESGKTPSRSPGSIATGIRFPLPP